MNNDNNKWIELTWRMEVNVKEREILGMFLPFSLK